MKLPRSIAFPGVKVPVYLVPDAKMIEVAGELRDGLWHENNHSIYIRKALKMEDRVAVFYHEMHHAVTDLDWEKEKLYASVDSGSKVNISENEHVETVPRIP